MNDITENLHFVLTLSPHEVEQYKTLAKENLHLDSKVRDDILHSKNAIDLLHFASMEHVTNPGFKGGHISLLRKFASLMPKKKTIVKSGLNLVHNLLHSKSKTTADHDRMFFFANEVYKAPSERATEMFGFHLDQNFNHKLYAVWVDGNKVILANRGTVVSDPQDLISDAHIVKGTVAQSQRLQDSLKVLDAVKNAYPNAQLATTGSSLGGSVSLYQNQHRPGAISHNYVFNPGVSPLSHGIDYAKSNNHISLVKGDVVSNSLLTKKLNSNTVIKKAVTYDPRKILQNHALDSTFLKDAQKRFPDGNKNITVV